MAREREQRYSILVKKAREDIQRQKAAGLRPNPRLKQDSPTFKTKLTERRRLTEGSKASDTSYLSSQFLADRPFSSILSAIAALHNIESSLTPMPFQMAPASPESDIPSGSELGSDVESSGDEGQREDLLSKFRVPTPGVVKIESPTPDSIGAAFTTNTARSSFQATSTTGHISTTIKAADETGTTATPRDSITASSSLQHHPTPIAQLSSDIFSVTLNNHAVTQLSEQSSKPERTCAICQTDESPQWIGYGVGRYQCRSCYYKGRVAKKSKQLTKKRDAISKKTQEVKHTRSTVPTAPPRESSNRVISPTTSLVSASLSPIVQPDSTPKMNTDSGQVCSHCGSREFSVFHKEKQLCHACENYWRKNNKPRPKELWGKTIIRRPRLKTSKSAQATGTPSLVDEAVWNRSPSSTQASTPPAPAPPPASGLPHYGFRCPFFEDNGDPCFKEARGEDPFKSLCAHIQWRHPTWNLQHGSQNEATYKEILLRATAQGYRFCVEDPFSVFNDRRTQVPLSRPAPVKTKAPDPRRDSVISVDDEDDDHDLRRTRRGRGGQINYYDMRQYGGYTNGTTSRESRGDESDYGLSGRQPSKAARPVDERLECRRRALAQMPILGDHDIQHHDMSASSWKTRASSSLSRELGLSSRARGNGRPYTFWKSWKGASHDVLELDWSPDGTKFVFGAAAHSDYNKGNNLVFGDMIDGILTELPEHYLMRESATAAALYGSSKEYMTISKVHWLADGKHMLSASYDKTVKLWEVNSLGCLVQATYPHASKVITMAVHSKDSIIATGIGNGPESISLIHPSASGSTSITAPLNFRGYNPHFEGLLPSSLAWGSKLTEDYLVAGFSRTDSKSGHLGVWKVAEAVAHHIPVSPWAMNVYDAIWHPTLPAFAVGSPAGAKTEHSNTRSVVRIYEPLRLPSSIVDFECPAADINSITFCPHNDNYVTASCTDAVTYVWDFRNPSEMLHKLPHGRPIAPIHEDEAIEDVDVGVRAVLWGDSMSQFYTGSSDGNLRQWDIRRGEEDSWTANVAHIGAAIMAASFSPDKSNILIGDDCASIHVLTNAPFDGSVADVSTDDEARSSSHQHTSILKRQQAQFAFKRANVPPENSLSSMEGILKARQFISTGQLEMNPVYGPGKGPNYCQAIGPKGRPYFADWARPPGTPDSELPTTKMLPSWRDRQLSGKRSKDRTNLTEKQKEDFKKFRETAFVFSGRRPDKKKGPGSKRKHSSNNSKERIEISLLSDDEGTPEPSQASTYAQQSTPMIVKSEPRWDVLSDSDDSLTYSKGDDVEDDSDYLEEDNFFPPTSQVKANIPTYPFDIF